MLEIGALALERGEHITVLLLKLIDQGEKGGVDALAEMIQGGMEFDASDEVGFGRDLTADDFFDDCGEAGDQGDGNAGGGGRGHLLKC